MDLPRRKFLTASACGALLGCCSVSKAAYAFCTDTTLEHFLTPNTNCTPAGLTLRNRDRLLKLYRGRNFAPLWTQHGQPSYTSTVVTGRLINSSAVGLDPVKYYGRLLQQLASDTKQNYLVEYELLLTDAMISYFDDLAHGTSSPPPADSGWRLVQSRTNVDAIAATFFNGQSTLRNTVAQLQPQHPRFQPLLDSLQKHLTILDNGGWSQVSNGPTLKPGERHHRVAQLRHRLTTSGDLFSNPTDQNLFDTTLQQALARFQARHGLSDDGILGPNTLRALNVSAEQRVAQLQLNLDRWRWLPRNLGDSNIMVNTAGYDMQVTVAGDVALDMKVIIGKPEHATKLFSDSVKHLVFKPSWYVPKSITQKLLAKEAANPGWLEKNNFEVRLISGDRPVSFDVLSSFDLDPAFFSARYWLRQLPGESNALGELKFMFPNKYSIYLHDTNARKLFSKSERAFSHGCVRLEKPQELAELLLSIDGRSPAQIESFRNADNTRKVNLQTPLPVHITYQTAWVDDNGATHFRDDIYEHDQHGLSQITANHEIHARAESSARALTNTTLVSNLN